MVADATGRRVQGGSDIGRPQRPARSSRSRAVQWGRSRRASRCVRVRAQTRLARPAAERRALPAGAVLRELTAPGARRWLGAAGRALRGPDVGAVAALRAARSTVGRVCPTAKRAVPRSRPIASATIGPRRAWPAAS